METYRSTRPRAAIAGALLAVYATSPGQTYVISQFNKFLCASPDGDLGGLGIAATTLSTAYLVGTLLSASLLTRAGTVADRIGPRRMIALAGVGLALAGLLFSRASGIVSLTVAFFALRFAGQGVMAISSSHALALRFEARLGSVEGLRGATTSLAIATAPLIAIAVVDAHGWRDGAWMLGLGAGVLAVVAAYGLLDRDPPATDGAEDAATGDGASAPTAPVAGHTLPEARATRAFWILAGCVAFTAAYVTAVHFHIQPLLSARGMGERAAAATFTPFAVVGVIGTLVGGVIVDRFRPAPILAASMLLLGAGGALMGGIAEIWAAQAGMGVIGAGHALLMAVSGPTLARYFGRACHGAIRGFSGTLAVAGAAGGPFLLSALASVPVDGAPGALGAAASVGFPVALLLASLSALPMAWLALGLERPPAPAR